MHTHPHMRARVHTPTVFDAQLPHNRAAYPKPGTHDSRFLRLRVVIQWKNEDDEDNTVHYPVIVIARCALIVGTVRWSFIMHTSVFLSQGMCDPDGKGQCKCMVLRKKVAGDAPAEDTRPARKVVFKENMLVPEDCDEEGEEGEDDSSSSSGSGDDSGDSEYNERSDRNMDSNSSSRSSRNRGNSSSSNSSNSSSRNRVSRNMGTGSSSSSNSNNATMYSSKVDEIWGGTKPGEVRDPFHGGSTGSSSSSSSNNAIRKMRGKKRLQQKHSSSVGSGHDSDSSVEVYGGSSSTKAEIARVAGEVRGLFHGGSTGSGMHDLTDLENTISNQNADKGKGKGKGGLGGKRTRDAEDEAQIDREIQQALDLSTYSGAFAFGSSENGGSSNGGSSNDVVGGRSRSGEDEALEKAQEEEAKGGGQSAEARGGEEEEKEEEGGQASRWEKEKATRPSNLTVALLAVQQEGGDLPVGFPEGFQQLATDEVFRDRQTLAQVAAYGRRNRTIVMVNTPGAVSVYCLLYNSVLHALAQCSLSLTSKHTILRFYRYDLRTGIPAS